ncbi:hypothetical protein CSPX01_13394 [Colletotrichum filicis]|nr:hypothetical protein CSPX01_13394 [Colletotrichum filicis]
MFSTLVPVACRTVRDTLDTTLGSPLFHFRATLSPRPYCPPPGGLTCWFLGILKCGAMMMGWMPAGEYGSDRRCLIPW